MRLILFFILLSCQHAGSPCQEICYAENSHNRAAYDECLKHCQSDNPVLEVVEPPVDPKSCWARCHDECPPTRRAICAAMCGEGKCHPSQCGDC